MKWQRTGRPWLLPASSDRRENNQKSRRNQHFILVYCRMHVCRYENVIFFLIFSVFSRKFRLEGHTSIAARTVEMDFTYLTSFPCPPLFKECRTVGTIEFPFCLYFYSVTTSP